MSCVVKVLAKKIFLLVARVTAIAAVDLFSIARNTNVRRYNDEAIDHLFRGIRI
jgi:hypothetical protein